MLGLPKPPRPPKPLTQPLGPGWLILMLRAATAPMLFAVPTAVMHWPTFSADGSAVTVLRYLVAAVVVTVTLVFVAVAEPAVRLLACTTKPLADTEVTLPSAPPKAPLPKAPRLPLGRGRGLKLGRGVAPARAAAAAEPAEPAAAEPARAGAVALDRGADGHAGGGDRLGGGPGRRGLCRPR